MSYDARDELWGAAFDTYYDAYYEELLADRIISYWQLLDEATKILVALTASGSAVSGWTLWNDPNLKYIWAILAASGAFVALVHASMGVPHRLKDWMDIKRLFAVLRIDIETFRYRISVNPDFVIDVYTAEFIEYRKRYGDGVQQLKNDFLLTRCVAKSVQRELNVRLKNNHVIV
jgi:hypothetical protein